MRNTTELDVFACRLDGISLIEASAGTGKTWNICGLYLRLLLERALEVQRILVVTFTNAATAELRERIRQRIVDTLQFLNGHVGADADPFVPRLVEMLRTTHAIADQTLVERLELALATFDEAAIFTIHGFCQRALADAPFTAHMPLQMELLQDDSDLVREAASDFWRRRLAGESLDPALAAYLVKRKDTPEKFGKLLKRHVAKPMAVAKWPRDIDAANAVDAASLAGAHAGARALWLEQREAIVELLTGALPDLNGTSYKPQSVQEASTEWDAVLQGHDPLAALELQSEKLALLGTTKLLKGTKKNQTTPTHPFFDAAQTLLDALDASEHALKLARLRLLRDLLDEGSRALREGKRTRRVVAFDDMLFNLHERLRSPDSTWLALALRSRFPVALVDEFQDTDPLQFAVFKAVYGAGDAPLFLVGDPKQAIYSFRNADLHTYLQARAQASAEYTLVENQRSTGPLIEALNGLFGTNPQAFMLPGLDYRAVELGAKPRKLLLDRTEARAALQVWTLPQDPESGEPQVKKQAQACVVGATAAEIARLLTAAHTGQITLDGKPLRAGDMAVLVRSHAEGSRMRLALTALRVGSVELSQSSIFQSPDAEELERLLSAILEPAREKLLRTAMSTELMGMDAAAIDTLAGDEARMLEAVQRFADLQQVWLQRGVGVMLRQWLNADQVAQRMLARADGERRLTNLLHLVECLHAASHRHPAPDALLRWFQTQRNDERSDDATQLRLESDQNLVQIVTIHRAKGLEYPIVFCPFLWNGRPGGFSDGLDGVEYHDDDGRTVIDYCKGFDDEYDEADVKARTRLDAAAEFLRLVYVALTRAVHRCVLVAGCYLTKHGKGTSPTESTHSLLNWLVAGAGMSPHDWFAQKSDVATIDAAWAALAHRCGPALAMAPLPAIAGVPVPASLASQGALAALAPPRHAPWGWWIGSYSALAHGAVHELAAVDHDLRVAAPAQTPEADAPGDTDVAQDDALRFPRGALAGECLHALFEQIDFTAPAHWPAAVASALRKLRPGSADTAPSAAAATGALHARMLENLLADVLHTPLPIGTADPLLLSQLPLERRLTELEFHLPSHRLEAPALNALLARHGYAAPALGFTALRGFLKGYIDLVFEHQGRYFILDWKSNHLGHAPQDYAQEPMARAMEQQGYHLQYLLYSVALDRHLRTRLADYDPAQHFGGVLYLFVRGVRPLWRTANGSPTGVYFHRPAPAVLAQLSALFNPAAVAA